MAVMNTQANEMQWSTKPGLMMRSILLKYVCILFLFICGAAQAELQITFENNADPTLVNVRATHIPTAGDDVCMWENYPCYPEGSNTATHASWFTSTCDGCYGRAWDKVPSSMLHPAGGTVNHFAGSYLGGYGGSRVIFTGLRRDQPGGPWFCVGIATNGNFRSKGVHKRCGLIPSTPTPPTPVCKIPVASINLPHGTLSASEVAGHKASMAFLISCTSTATLRVRATNVVNGSSSFQLRAADNLWNTLTIDNIDGATGKVITTGTSGQYVEVRSELYLKGQDAIPGPFSGNAVFILDII